MTDSLQSASMVGAFPVQHASLFAPALAIEVCARYGLGASVRCELIRHGLNDNYVVRDGDAKYVLRVYRAGWRTESDIRWELELIEHLKAQGAPVAAVIHTRDGELFWRLQAPEGVREVALFEFARGRPHWSEGFSLDRCRVYGEGVAAIHLAMDTFTSQHQRFGLDFDHIFHQPLRAIEPRIAHRPDDWFYLCRLAKQLESTITDLDAKGLARGPCHGDFHTLNASFDEETGAYTFYDFDCGGPGWRAYDIAVFRWALHFWHSDATVSAEEAWAAFLGGYRSKAVLSDRDESAIDAFVAAREIWLLGLHAANGADWGYGFLNDAYYDQHLKALREWESTKLRPGAAKAETPKLPPEPVIRLYEPGDQDGVRWLYERTPPVGGVSVRRHESVPKDLEAIDDYYEAFWVAIEPTRDGDAVVGITGLERCGEKSVSVPTAGVPTADFVDLSVATARLHHVMVVPERQRRGIGRKLMNAAIEWARANRYEKMVLETTTEQEGAIAFYRTLGFKELGRTSFHRWEMVWFELKL